MPQCICICCASCAIKHKYHFLKAHGVYMDSVQTASQAICAKHSATSVSSGPRIYNHLSYMMHYMMCHSVVVVCCEMIRSILRHTPYANALP